MPAVLPAEEDTTAPAEAAVMVTIANAEEAAALLAIAPAQEDSTVHATP
jgi:hypothetical protein